MGGWEGDDSERRGAKEGGNRSERKKSGMNGSTAKGREGRKAAGEEEKERRRKKRKTHNYKMRFISGIRGALTCSRSASQQLSLSPWRPPGGSAGGGGGGRGPRGGRGASSERGGGLRGRGEAEGERGGRGPSGRPPRSANVSPLTSPLRTHQRASLPLDWLKVTRSRRRRSCRRLLSPLELRTLALPTTAFPPRSRPLPRTPVRREGESGWRTRVCLIGR